MVNSNVVRTWLVVCAAAMFFSYLPAVAQDERALWASIAAHPSKKEIISTGDYYQSFLGKVLVTWRMLPGDDATTGFDLYRHIGTGSETKLNSQPITTATCWQDAALTNYTHDVTYRLTRSGSSATLSQHTIKADQLSQKIPYISIPLQPTTDVCAIDSVFYPANDISVGDLDRDGQMELIVKRLQGIRYADGTMSEGTGAGYSHPDCLYPVIWDAYRLDGTFLWRVKGGPGVMLGNSSCFAVADFDGDGRAEMAIRTVEGTVFGDGMAIPDTDSDGVIDYRTWDNYYKTGDARGWKDHYCSAGPEFLSVIDGLTGRELARTDFIPRETSESWGDNYWKRANSLRIGVGCFDGRQPSIFMARGVYARTVAEAWDYRDGQLTRRWHFDTSAAGGEDSNRDGKPNSAYAGQGNHSFSVADLDGDGLDEVMYGSMAIDHDGVGLWTTGLGHGDAQHVGHFLPDRDGLQVYHCLESGKTMVALHDARDGSIIWDKVGTSAGDMGRCMVADVAPGSPGCEFWYYGNELFAQDGTELMTADGTARAKEKSSNMAIWFDGTLSRQLIDGGIINSYANGRTFTMYRYDESFINGTKSNPGWYGDLLGDWREEVILPSADKLTDIKIFSTWYPTEHKLPWLMTDHTYLMSALNENVGYNQPTHTGYYLGSDWTSDADIWAAASAAPGGMDYATYILGDVNGSGSVDIGDAVCIVNHLVGKDSETIIERVADTNGNGQIDIGDAVCIVNLLVGKIASFDEVE